MRDTLEPSHGNRGTSLSGAGDMESVETSAWTFTKMEWRNIPRIFLGLIIAFTWSSSAFAQISIDGHYWEYDGRSGERLYPLFHKEWRRVCRFEIGQLSRHDVWTSLGQYRNG